MLGLVRGDRGIVGVLFASAGVSDDGIGHAFDLIEWFLHAPKAAASKDRCLGFGANRGGQAEQSEDEKKLMHGCHMRML